jgi:hypothetical protein
MSFEKERDVIRRKVLYWEGIANVTRESSTVDFNLCPVCCISI